MEEIPWILSALTVLVYGLGIASTFDAIMTARTSQGAIAWAISLCTFPLLSLPLYWIFGRTHFNGYVNSLRDHDQRVSRLVTDTIKQLPDALVDEMDLSPGEQVLSTLAALPFTHRNQAELYSTGRETFDAIFAAMDRAQDYILVQFYIIHDDGLGRELLAHMKAARERGVRVFLIYDEIGSPKLRRAYKQDMTAADVEWTGFRTSQGPKNRFQLNFRNHRKIVVVDGNEAFIGGHNVGDEYLGLSPRFGLWRDTHCRVQGPCVLSLQIAFCTDWNWAKKTLPEQLNWKPSAAPEQDQQMLVIPSGPADELETWKLSVLQCIQEAKERFWLVSPYFVPDRDVISALQLAALRGVDVRILLPEKPDHLPVWLASFTYLPEMDMPNLSFYRYQPGFLHQKVLLVDKSLAIVGTANADNRSFRLNFEISLLGISPQFVQEVEEMLEEDFRNSRCTPSGDYASRPIHFRFGAQVSRLLAPIL